MKRFLLFTLLLAFCNLESQSLSYDTLIHNGDTFYLHQAEKNDLPLKNNDLIFQPPIIASIITGVFFSIGLLINVYNTSRQIKTTFKSIKISSNREWVIDFTSVFSDLISEIEHASNYVDTLLIGKAVSQKHSYYEAKTILFLDSTIGPEQELILLIRNYQNYKIENVNVWVDQMLNLANKIINNKK